jgi:hypothetical protein
MKFFVRYLPNGRILVRSADTNQYFFPETFKNLKEATEFMQKMIDMYGGLSYLDEDPTGMDDIFGDD